MPPPARSDRSPREEEFPEPAEGEANAGGDAATDIAVATPPIAAAFAACATTFSVPTTFEAMTAEGGGLGAAAPPAPDPPAPAAVATAEGSFGWGGEGASAPMVFGLAPLGAGLFAPAINDKAFRLRW